MAMNVVKYRLRKDDNVEVIAGKDKGKQGRLVRIDHEKGRAVVQGVNMVKKAVRKKKKTDRGGIVEVEASIHISNIMIVCRKCGPTRTGYKIAGDKKTRVCRKCGEAL